MISTSLPFWLSGPEIAKLQAAIEAWWARVETWLRWPLGQLDPLTCAVPILDALAWQRDIQRFRYEPLSLYRARVNLAFLNAADSGELAGFASIFERLGLALIDQEERFDEVDWDVIRLTVAETELVSDAELMAYVIRQYGRTCRRYQLAIATPVGVEVSVLEVGLEYAYDVAYEEPLPYSVSVFPHAESVGNDSQLWVARL